MSPTRDMLWIRLRTIQLLVFTTFSLAVSGTRPVWAQPVGPEFQVNTFTTNAQDYPSVAKDGAGNFVVAWESGGQDGNGGGVFGQRYDNNGDTLGGEFQVNTYITSNQTRPSVAMDGAGNFVVVWQSLGQDGEGSGIFGQRYDSAGNPVGSEFQVNTFTSGKQGLPSVAMNPSGDFVVVWTSFGQDGDGDGIFGQRYDSTGCTAGAEFQVNTYFTSAQFEPSVAMDGSGNFVVVWASSGQDGSSFGVYGQRYNNAGGPAGPEFRVNTYTTNAQRLESVAMDGSGDFIVVWQSLDQDGSSYGIFGKRYDSLGTPLAPEFQVNTYITNQQQCGHVAADGTGNFVVVWASNGQDGNSYGIFGRQYDSTGDTLGTEFQVNTYVTSSQTHPSVAFDDSGNFVVAWASNGQDGSNFGIFGQRYDAGTVTAVVPRNDFGLQLSQNHPNPFNPTTTIEYSLPEAMHVSLGIHDAQGRVVIILDEGLRSRGLHASIWDGRDRNGHLVGSGVYFYRLQAGANVAAKKLLLLK